MVIEFSLQILEEYYTNINFHENSTSGNSIVLSGKSYIRIQLFQIGNFAISPKCVITSPSVYRQTLHESTDRRFYSQDGIFISQYNSIIIKKSINYTNLKSDMLH